MVLESIVPARTFAGGGLAGVNTQDGGIPARPHLLPLTSADSGSLRFASCKPSPGPWCPVQAGDGAIQTLPQVFQSEIRRGEVSKTEVLEQRRGEA